MKPPYLIVSGDFVKAGGMNQPNYELARYLAEEGFETHLVGYRVADDLARHPSVTFHRVPKPAGSYFLSQPLMNRLGRRWAREIGAADGRVIVNGACCDWDDINWVHHVQAVFAPQVTGDGRDGSRIASQRHVDLATERRIVPRAKLAITNTERMKRDIVERLGFPMNAPMPSISASNPRSSARPPPKNATRPAPASTLCRFDSAPERGWSLSSARSETPAKASTRCSVPGPYSVRSRPGMRTWWWWRGRRAAGLEGACASAGIAPRIRFLDFDRDDAFVARVLWGCDVLVLPSRYEGYGRPVQEALCCGVPALVSRASGIAEQYHAELAELLIPDPKTPKTSRRGCALARGADIWRERIRPSRPRCASTPGAGWPSR